jgi:hypothetical protein
MLNGLDDEATASSVSLNAAIGVRMSDVGTYALQLQGESTSIQRLAGQLKVMHTDSLNQREALENLSPDTLGQWYTVLNESKQISGDATSLMLAQINTIKGITFLLTAQQASLANFGHISHYRKSHFA